MEYFYKACYHSNKRKVAFVNFFKPTNTQEETSISTSFAGNNTQTWSTQQLILIALMSALSIILSFIEIPLFPAAPFLKYDPSLSISLAAGLLITAQSGFIVACVSALVHALIIGNWVGALMNITVALFFVFPTCLIWRSRSGMTTKILALLVGSALACLAALAANLSLGVIFWYGSLEAILPLIIPVLLPFNLLKSLLNSILVIGIVKALEHLKQAHR